MKTNLNRKLQFLTSAASLMAFVALAQDTINDPKGPTDKLQARAERMQRLSGAPKATDVIGAEVQNYQNEKLGKIQDLAVDVASGRIVQVIIATDTATGAETLTAVPPGALHYDAADKVVHLDADKERLKTAPRFDMAKWAECCDYSHVSAVYGYYYDAPTTGVIEGVVDSEGQRIKDGSLSSNLTRTTDGKRNDDRMEGRDVLILVREMRDIRKASDLMGEPVVNQEDVKVGKVENLLVDLPSGRVVAMVVSTGEYLGMQDEYSAVPPAALRADNRADRRAYQVDASKEVLSKAPHFKSTEWPNFNEPTYVNKVYRAYNIQPYFVVEGDPEADNTSRNIRDRNNTTLTPIDQGHSKSDREITTQIRKEILANKNMSVNAKNVKIITKNGQVTLRGPVNTPSEKRFIGEVAARIASSDRVDNQLEVAVTTTSTE